MSVRYQVGSNLLGEYVVGTKFLGKESQSWEIVEESLVHTLFAGDSEAIPCKVYRIVKLSGDTAKSLVVTSPYLDSFMKVSTDNVTLSPNAPTVTNELGAKQSALDFDFTGLDTKAMFNLTAIIKQGGEKYGKGDWRLIIRDDHLNHALVHIFAYLDGNTQDDHLGHAFCRLMMAIGVDK